MSDWTTHLGDCYEHLLTLPSESMDSIISDPPAGISFQDYEWDENKGGRIQWVAWMEGIARECLRVLKPGGRAIVWSIPRTSHWTAWAWESAGWVPEGMILHIYRQGFPKNLDVSKAMDKQNGRLQGTVTVESVKNRMTELFLACGKTRKQVDTECGFPTSGYMKTAHPDRRPNPWTRVVPSVEKWRRMREVMGCEADLEPELLALASEVEREVVGKTTKVGRSSNFFANSPCEESQEHSWNITAPATEAAKQWEGWGTALKPAQEGWWLFRKPETNHDESMTADATPRLPATA